MKENLPINVDESQQNGTISYANDVIATIVGVATAEVEGIAEMAGASSFSNLLGGSKTKGLLRGVKVEVGPEEVAVDVSVIVDYGTPIQKVGNNVQENIRKSIESMTGLHVINVDVHVVGVSFEKENKELEEGQEFARIADAQVQQEDDVPNNPVMFTQEDERVEADEAPQDVADEAQGADEKKTKKSKKQSSSNEEE